MRLGNLTQRQNNDAGLSENFYYDNLYRLDHSSLGGITNLALTFDATGNITSRSDVAAGASWTYDANRIHAVTQACTWSGPPTNGTLTKINAVTRHGYTWQTVLGSLGLNDMNGRIQDAVTGRFLSPDPSVSKPGFTQSYNRYSYVNNNPLSFVDPSGFIPHRTGLDGGAGNGQSGDGSSGSADGSDGGNSGGNGASADAGAMEEVTVTGNRGGDSGVLPASVQIVGSPQGTGERGDGGDSSKTKLPEVTVSTNRPKSLPPVIPISPFLAPYPAGTFQSYVNTLDFSPICRYSSANNPSVQRNIVTGGTVGFLTFGTVGAVVVLNIVGFPEVELAEGGAAALGGGAWLFEAAVAEPAGSMAIGGLSAGAYGTTLGGTVGYLGTPSTCP